MNDLKKYSGIKKFWLKIFAIMQRNNMLREIKNVNQPSCTARDVLRAHNGIVQQFKYKAMNQNATDIDTAMNSMRDTLYNLIRNNGNNTTQKISIGIT